MALSLGIKNGSKLSIGQHCLEVKRIISGNMIVVVLDDAEDFTVTDLQATEILPNVRVFAGIGQNGNGSRLAFEAPESIEIRRMGFRSEGAGKKLIDRSDRISMILNREGIAAPRCGPIKRLFDPYGAVSRFGVDRTAPCSTPLGLGLWGICLPALSWTA